MSLMREELILSLPVVPPTTHLGICMEIVGFLLAPTASNHSHLLCLMYFYILL